MKNLYVTLLFFLISFVVKASGDEMKKQEELDYYHHYTKTILSFLKSENDTGISQQTLDIAKGFEEVINNAYDKKNLRGLKLLAKDFEEMVSGLKPGKKVELEEQLKSSD